MRLNWFWILLLLILLQSGCARLFGWDIHAPGLLSENFSETLHPSKERVALYLAPKLLNFQSTNRGGRFADPQVYYVGEAFGPMLVEAFQAGFEEFIFMEIEPTPAILKRYEISHVVFIQIKDFANRVTLKGQALGIKTETVVKNMDLNLVARFESEGVSDARKVFAKKGGPEVNLNAALENNAASIVQYLQDSISNGVWKGNLSS